jgi:hypothetical protein
MKYLKRFEDINDYPEYGDYIQIKINSMNDDWREYVNNTIGEVYGIIGKNADGFDDDHDMVAVKYDNPPEYVKRWMTFNFYGNDEYTRDFSVERIVAYGKTLEELNMKLRANKFNL